MSKQPLEDLKEFLIDEIPDNLFHYTNLSGLQGIVSNSEIWFSNLYYLNDKTEYELGLKIAVERLENYKKGFSVLKSTKYFVESLEKAIDFIKQKDPPYILSLTANDDLLSQWRGYTENGVGVNIGLNKNFLRKDSLNIFKCIYNREKQIKMVDKIVTDSIFRFVGISDSQGIFKSDKEVDLKKYDKAVSIAGNYFIDRIILASSLIKDNSFVEEDEWRILLMNTNYEIEFLNKGNYYKPYIKYNIDNISKIIGSIKIGSNQEKELCQSSIELLLKKYSIDKNKITHSIIPYRN